MKIPADTHFQRLRARVRLLTGNRDEKAAVWPILNPGEDGGDFGMENTRISLDRKTGLDLAEKLGRQKPALVFFPGPGPTKWPDIFDVAEILRGAGACTVLITRPGVLNAMSAPPIAYHFTSIYCVLSAQGFADDLRRVKILTALHPRGRVEARVFGELSGQMKDALTGAGTARVCQWPPAKARKCLVIDGAEIKASESLWCSDHIWLRT